MAKTNSKAARKSSTAAARVIRLARRISREAGKELEIPTMPAKPAKKSLPKIDRDALGSRLIDLAMKFAAIRRLAGDIEDHDKAVRGAALQGVESMALLGSLEADAISRSIGGSVLGAFGEEARAIAAAAT